MYPQRWWVLLTAVGIQIFNFAHFAAFPSVNKVMSKYYHQVQIKCFYTLIFYNNLVSKILHFSKHYKKCMYGFNFRVEIKWIG